MSDIKSFNDILEEQMSAQDQAATEALEEYLDSLKEMNKDNHTVLEEKLKDKEYYEEFKKSLMQMSILLSAAMATNSEEEHEYTKIQKKVLSYAKNDDDLTKEMRLSYAKIVTADSLKNFLQSEEERNLYTQRMKSFVEAMENFV